MSYLITLEDSIKRILLTPLGTRVMLPTFGSKLHTLIDKRADQTWKLLFISYVYEALKKWEPRAKIRKAIPNIDAVSGEVTISLELESADANQIQKLEIVYASA
ncbi:putative phage-related baseplate assembly protein (GPW-like) [Sulfurovum sp. enrichment culture clone C5]|uniref:Putative phage-related baseplate assembly protein (GPW-like) n=1 Tax=Sulfurovum sp. enrichment culture clone C5 TaxID=497650 RepID=A0A0S4XLR8_9BACT|nr:putative phage-related baseplate assembly protein (GPW-like) [Sulfurovum sp. enrichment culture clone C5]